MMCKQKMPKKLQNNNKMKRIYYTIRYKQKLNPLC